MVMDLALLSTVEGDLTPLMRCCIRVRLICPDRARSWVPVVATRDGTNGEHNASTTTTKRRHSPEVQLCDELHPLNLSKSKAVSKEEEMKGRTSVSLSTGKRNNSSNSSKERTKKNQPEVDLQQLLKTSELTEALWISS